MKWLAITVIVILTVITVGGGYFLWQQTHKLGEAEAEIVSLEGNVASLEGNVATLEGNVSTLETDLAELEATVSTLEADLETTNGEIEDLQADLSTQQNINSSLSAELKKVKDPRHFASLTELVDWLHKDDTDTKYKDEEWINLSFILQVRALRDGYLLPVSFYEEGGRAYAINRAVIEDNIYSVWANTDHTAWHDYILAIPSHPLPLD